MTEKRSAVQTLTNVDYLRALLWVNPSKLVLLLGRQFWFGTFFKPTKPGDQSELKSLGFQVNTVPWPPKQGLEYELSKTNGSWQDQTE